MERYPRTIVNGAGEELTFVRRVQEPDGDRVEVRNRVHPGSGPPMHVHYLQEESITVEQGTLAYQVQGGETQYASVGETVCFERGIHHRFWNAGEEDLICTGWVKPALNFEYFLSAIYDSTASNGGKRPKGMDAAFLCRRYRTEFEMSEIPQFVQRVIFPIQVAIGRMTGAYRKYADAPEPVRTSPTPPPSRR